MIYPTRWYDMPPVSNEEALKADCPKCGAKKGEPCRYIPLVNKQFQPPWIGRPTRNAHNDRRVARSKDELAGLNKTRAAALRAWLLEHGDLFKEAHERCAEGGGASDRKHS